MTLTVYATSASGDAQVFQTKKKAMDHFRLTNRELGEHLDKGVTVQGWTLTTQRPADFVEPVQGPSDYIVDGNVSSIGTDLINCLKDETGVIITKMRSDGYLHATSMCSRFGKLWTQFNDLEKTKRFMNALSCKLEKPISNTQVTLVIVSYKIIPQNYKKY